MAGTVIVLWGVLALDVAVIAWAVVLLWWHRSRPPRARPRPKAAWTVEAIAERLQRERDELEPGTEPLDPFGGIGDW